MWAKDQQLAQFCDVLRQLSEHADSVPCAGEFTPIGPDLEEKLLCMGRQALRVFADARLATRLS